MDFNTILKQQGVAKNTTPKTGAGDFASLMKNDYKAPEKGVLGSIASGVKAFTGGVASGVGGVALTAEDYLARKAGLLKGKPSLQEQFKTQMGGQVHPNLYGAGQLGGEIATLAAPVGVAGKIGKGVAEGLGAGTKVAKLAQAGTEGLAFTAGQSAIEGKKQSLSDYAENAGINMLIPGGQMALKGISESVPSRIINSLIKPLAKDFSYGKNPGKSIAELGIKGNNFEDLISNIKTKIGDIGSKIGQVVSQSPNLQKIDLSSSLKPLDEAINVANKTPRTNASLIQRLESVKADLLDNIKKGIDPQSYKGLIGDLTKWTGSVSDDQAVNKALKQTYGSTRSAMDEVLQKELTPEQFSEYKKNSEHYGNLLSAKNAAEYRDKIVQRHDLISFGAKNAGLLGALGTAVATGGVGVGTLLAGLGGVIIDKASASPAFKTRLASLLAKLPKGEVATFFEKIPSAKTLFAQKEIDSMTKGIKDAKGSIVKAIKSVKK